MNKLFMSYLVAVVAIVALTWGVRGAAAADLTFVCDPDIDGGSCSLSSHDPLFSASNVAPGHTQRRSIAVENKSDTDACTFYLGVDDVQVQPGNFGEQLFVAVKGIGDNEGDKIGKTDNDAATSDKKITDIRSDDGAKQVDIIAANQTREYEWLITFNKDAGNEFMGANITFAADLTGTCESDEGTVAGITTTAPPGGGGQVLGATTDAALAPTGVWRARVLWAALLLGVGTMIRGLYVWERQKSRA